MPKKKKTRKQKIVSDQRRQTSPTVSHVSKVTLSEHPKERPTTPSIHPEQVVQKPTLSHAIATNDYLYLSRDLLRIATLTGVIVIIELLLRFFVLKA